MVQQFNYKDTSLGGALAQGLQGLTEGAAQGFQLGMKSRAYQALEQYYQGSVEVQKGNQELQAQRDRLQRVETFSNLSPKMRVNMFDYFAEDLFPGIDKSTPAYADVKKAMGDDDAVNSIISYSVANGMDPAAAQTLGTLANNGKLADAMGIVLKFQQGKQAESEAKATESYRQQQLALESDKLNETTRHNQATEQDTGFVGSPTTNADAELVIRDKRGQLYRFDQNGQPVPYNSATPEAPAAPEPTSSPQGLKPLNEANRQRVESILKGGADPEKVRASLERQGFDPTSIPSFSPTTEVAEPPSPYLKGKGDKPTEQENTTLVRYNAGVEAFGGMARLIGDGFKPSWMDQAKEAVKGAVSSVPVVGEAAGQLVSPLLSYTQNDKFREFEAYQESVLQQIIRAETGAGGGESAEVAERMNKRYRILANDPPTVVEAKLRGMHEYLKTMGSTLGRSKGVKPLPDLPARR